MMTSDPLTVCFPRIVMGDSGPECFVAEVSSSVSDCSTQGREELTDARRNAALDEHCRSNGLSAEECDAYSACGVVKFTDAEREPCEAGESTSTPGFCLASELPDSCPASAFDALFIHGSADAPLRSSAPDSLQVFCAVDRKED